ncbi:Succinate dehydrogenase flavin-adding protein, antitoxin of CptAB toxin-antitoxin [hydrothermal vent metagenome]|uniref:Succinate dehydrogenase flavin-adding protein, antitoxin of CptAB toxin-antitoxin n=1 Tax=hydrothermal vent metagenome TaxID=652676 RepID=A0A3B0TN27_9ZZZZ
MSDARNKDKKQNATELNSARKRALYRAWHRGTKELDLILGRYCEAHIDKFDDGELALFEKLMENEETDLQAWLMGQVEIPSNDQGKMLSRIRNFHLKLNSKTSDFKTGGPK